MKRGIGHGLAVGMLALIGLAGWWWLRPNADEVAVLADPGLPAPAPTAAALPTSATATLPELDLAPKPEQPQTAAPVVGVAAEESDAKLRWRGAAEVWRAGHDVAAGWQRLAAQPQRSTPELLHALQATLDCAIVMELHDPKSVLRTNFEALGGGPLKNHALQARHGDCVGLRDLRFNPMDLLRQHQQSLAEDERMLLQRQRTDPAGAALRIALTIGDVDLVHAVARLARPADWAALGMGWASDHLDVEAANVVIAHWYCERLGTCSGEALALMPCLVDRLCNGDVRLWAQRRYGGDAARWAAYQALNRRIRERLPEG